MLPETLIWVPLLCNKMHRHKASRAAVSAAAPLSDTASVSRAGAQPFGADGRAAGAAGIYRRACGARGVARLHLTSMESTTADPSLPRALILMPVAIFCCIKRFPYMLSDPAQSGVSAMLVQRLMGWIECA